MDLRSLFLGALAVVAIGLAYWLGTHYSTPDSDFLAATSSASIFEQVTEEKKETPTPTPKPAAVASGTAGVQFCPKFAASIERGDSDLGQVSGGMLGDVGNLQKLLAQRYGLNEVTFVIGTFGEQTEAYLKRYQREEGLAQTGVLDAATIERILSYCLKPLTAQGGEYAKQSFTFATGSITMRLNARSAMQESGGTVLNGAFRIEVISISGSSARLRVTGRALGGLVSHTLTLARGNTITTAHAPGLAITLQSVDSAGATFVISQKSN